MKLFYKQNDLLLTIFFLISAHQIQAIVICNSDKDCEPTECCLLYRDHVDSESYCVPQIFCNKKVGGGSCFDVKECYSGCCVGMKCRTAEFCFDRYITPIVNGAALTVFLLLLCILSCCYACRMSGRQKRLQQEIYLVRYRLSQLLPRTQNNTTSNANTPISNSNIQRENNNTPGNS